MSIGQSELGQRGFPTEEFQGRLEKVTQYLQSEGMDGYVVINPYNIFYLGLYYYPGKRPVIFFVHKSGRVYAFTPDMEAHEARKLEYLERVIPYDDNYDQKEDLFAVMGRVIRADFPDARKVYVDEASVDKLDALKGIFDAVTVHDQILTIRAVKTPLEMEMMRISGRYSDYLVEYSRRYLKPGATELGILNRGITDTVDKMIEDGLQVVYVPGGPAGGLVPSGPNTARPHALPSQRAVQAGENMLLSMGANVWGYRTECERTHFLGEPTPQMREPFEVMRQAQELGIRLMKPGAVCQEVEAQVLRFITEAGYGDYIRHRTGHGKGLEEHEPPYVAAGDETVMQPGMIFSSEPGIYIEGLAGFRHSDNVLVTPEGCELLTNYPKSLEEMILPV